MKETTFKKEDSVYQQMGHKFKEESRVGAYLFCGAENLTHRNVV
jgi:hypothetical protein